MAQALPRGIQIVQWQNADKSKVIKYRIRIKRKDFQCDELFDDLKEAKEFLFNSKTKQGIAGIELKKEEERINSMSLAVKEYLKIKVINLLVKEYITKYIDTIVIDSPMRQKRVFTIKSALKTFCETEIVIEKEVLNKGQIAYRYEEPVKLGNMSVNELSHIHLDQYINKRKNTVKRAGNTLIKKSTIITELSIVKKFFTKLNKLDNGYFENYDYQPIFSKIDRELLQYAKEKRRFTVKGDDQLNLFKALDNYSNPEMKQIVLLSLYTGMRNSEVVMLKANQINLEENYIHLKLTKSNRERFVYLTNEARELIQSFNIPDFKSENRVFKYKLGGFEGGYKHFRNINPDLKHIKTHDFRRTMITNSLKQLGVGNSILISEFLGIKNSQGMVKEYAPEEIKDLSTQQGIKESVGHKDDNQTQGYTTL